MDTVDSLFVGQECVHEEFGVPLSGVLLAKSANRLILSNGISFPVNTTKLSKSGRSFERFGVLLNAWEHILSNPSLTDSKNCFPGMIVCIYDAKREMAMFDTVAVVDRPRGLFFTASGQVLIFNFGRWILTGYSVPVEQISKTEELSENLRQYYP